LNGFFRIWPDELNDYVTMFVYGGLQYSVKGVAMSGVRNSHQDVDIDIGRLFLAVWEKKGRVLLATAVITALAFFVTSLIKPDYQSETRVLIELRDTNVSKTDANNPSAQPQLDDLGIASQVQLMKSVDLIKTVARDMKLYDLEEFNTNQGAFAGILAKLGVGRSNANLPPEERVLEAFNKKLDVYQIEKSRVIGIQFTSKDPKLAAAIPNKIAEVFLSLQSGAKLDTNSETTKWLEPEIADLRKKVEEAEAKVADYRKSSDLLPTGKDNSFADQQLNDISVELTRVRSEYATAQARAQNVKNALSNGTPVDTLTEVMASPTIQKLKETETNIMGRISDLSVTLMPSHPQLKGLSAQLSAVRAQIREESQKVASGLQNEANIGKERERVLLDQLTQLKAQSATAGENSVTLKALEREATAQRDLLEAYLARYRQATSRTAENATPADARIVSNATEPTDVFFPKKIPITIVAAVGTLVVSSIIIMLTELFTGRALQPVNVNAVSRREEDDYKPQLNATSKSYADGNLARSRTAPASMPEKSQGSLVGRLMRNPLSAMADAGRAAAAEIENRPFQNADFAASPAGARSNRSDLEFQPKQFQDERFEREVPVQRAIEPKAVEPQNDPQSDGTFSVDNVSKYLAATKVPVAFCLAPTGDNGSLATVILARNIAGRGLKTILIDLSGYDMSSQFMTDTRGLSGLTDLLTGHTTIANSIHADTHSEADIIPGGNSDPYEAAQSLDRLPMIVDALKGAYDMVILDCGTMEIENVLHLSRNLDAEIILSAPAGDRMDVEGALTEINDAGHAEVILMTMQKSEKRAFSGRRAA